MKQLIGGSSLATVFIYNNYTGVVEKYYRGLLEAMPYVTGRTMTVGEFRANSNTNIVWTDTRMIESWNAFRSGWGNPLFIGYAFKRIWEGGHTGQSQHYAGVALDVGHTLSATERERLRRYAVNSGLWSYVEPASLAPRWVHVDDRYGPSACAAGGFPPLSLGSKGVYVFVLQDALTALGFTAGGLDGNYGYGTRSAVSSFQSNQGLPVNGIVDCVTWQRLTARANGIGLTPTVIR